MTMMLPPTPMARARAADGASPTSYTRPAMDLHVVGPAATHDERAAVDAFLDPLIGRARGGWDGGERDVAVDGRVARGGHEARAHRDLLLPVLHAIQDRIGWISQGALNHACRRLTVPPADAYGVASFYALLSTVPRPANVVHVCDALACGLAGAEQTCADLERELGPAGHPREGPGATWLRSPCLGQCERAPVALFTLAGDPPTRLATGPIDGPAILRQLAVPAEPDRSPLAAHRATRPSPERLAAVRAFVPQATQDGLRLLARVGRVDPTSLDDFLASGGYLALRDALAMGPAQVIEELGKAQVLGRGGAAFPSGRKWEAVAAAPAPRYVICNADEAEPGTFKDRAILEEDPFSLVEAMTIAGLAIGAARGYLYIRGEYPLGEARVANAIRLARDAGYLGDRILGTDLGFDIEIRRGGGAYIGGEETALLESIEGDRAEPRMKPPFPAEVGLFGRPTAINNVETLVNVPWIVLEGGEMFATIGSGGSTGTKLFSLSGHVARPGVYEVPFGATLGELIAVAGGVPGGRALKAVLLGGAAGVFVGPESLDLPLTYEAARAARVTLGSGAVVVFDETTDITAILLRIAAFFRDESCGQCVPCRVGTVRQEELLARLAARRPLGTVEDELALLADLGQVLRDASICGLGQTANEAVRTGIRFAGVPA
jgi:NADH-quinone oxidoreductase subunit F